jgi:hypothetical protein
VFEKKECQELFFSLNRKGRERISIQGFLIDLEKNFFYSYLTISSMLFQKDFLLPAIRGWTNKPQKHSFSPFLQIDEKEMRIFLIQKIPLFLPKQFEIVLPRFLFFAKRWCSLIQELT